MDTEASVWSPTMTFEKCQWALYSVLSAGGRYVLTVDEEQWTQFPWLHQIIAWLLTYSNIYASSQAQLWNMVSTFKVHKHQLSYGGLVTLKKNEKMLSI